MEYLNLGGNATSHERNSVLCSEESAATGADGFPTVSLARGEIGIIDTGDDADTGERVQRCEDHLSETFFATYGDGLGNVDLHQLMASHRGNKGLATVTTVTLRSQYGTVEFNENGLVTNFREKPVIPNCWINAGFFVFEKEAFNKSSEGK